jgi:hypothetical protein
MFDILSYRSSVDEDSSVLALAGSTNFSEGMAACILKAFQ